MTRFKKGMIILWSGSIATIPGGWKLCDGTNGTPNLENSFIDGAGDTYVVAATGGATHHEHGQTGDTHGHDIPSGSAISAGSDFSNATSSPQGQSNIDAAEGLPPYYALAYIMKL